MHGVHLHRAEVLSGGAVVVAVLLAFAPPSVCLLLAVGAAIAWSVSLDDGVARR